jgi:hypothetical protein
MAIALVLSGVLAQTALANDTADLSVEGRLAPGSCDIIGDLSMDLGDVALDKLHDDAGTLLFFAPLPFSIACDGKYRVGLRFTDNAPGPVYQGTWYDQSGDIQPVPLDPEKWYSLGTANDGKPLGLWNAYITVPSAVPPHPSIVPMHSEDRGLTWTKAFEPGFYMSSNDPNFLIGFSDFSGPAIPRPYRVVPAMLNARVIAAPKRDMGAKDTVRLYGSATMELVYL